MEIKNEMFVEYMYMFRLIWLWSLLKCISVNRKDSVEYQLIKKDTSIWSSNIDTVAWSRQIANNQNLGYQSCTVNSYRYRKQNQGSSENKSL